MIAFFTKTLSNGLKVIVHPDNSTPIAAVNIMYNVGSKHENPNKTGFAHLFEHLMFGGSINIPVFDQPLTAVGGDNNAFTTNDLTNYYESVPAANIETAFWLESDRMLQLAFSKKSLDVQKKVVIEEFNQRYLNQPYGDVWLLLRPLAYKEHPYQWPTIGKSTKHIQDATLNDVKNFFYHHYAPNNAVLCVVGPVEPESVFSMAEKWFGPIEHRNVDQKPISPEPEQSELRHLEVERDVPFNAIYKAYHMSKRNHPDYAPTDLLSDILSNGKSSRLYQHLVKEQQLFSTINAYITGDMENGLFVITGQLFDGVSYQAAEKAIDNELEKIIGGNITEYELQKVQNKFEANFIYDSTNALNKAMNLCYYEMLGDANMLNKEVEVYQQVTLQDISRVAAKLFRKTNCSTLYYKSKKS